MCLANQTKVMNPTIIKSPNQIMETITKISPTKACQLLYLYKINTILKPKITLRTLGRARVTCRNIKTETCRWVIVCRFSPRASLICRISSSMHLQNVFSWTKRIKLVKFKAKDSSLSTSLLKASILHKSNKAYNKLKFSESRAKYVKPKRSLRSC